jgi:hypothetical protein
MYKEEPIKRRKVLKKGVSVGKKYETLFSFFSTTPVRSTLNSFATLSHLQIINTIQWTATVMVSEAFLISKRISSLMVPSLLANQQQNIVSTFPPPHYFYKMYSDFALGKSSEWPKDEQDQPLKEVFEPPAPPPPIQGNFSMFGKVYTVRGAKN